MIAGSRPKDRMSDHAMNAVLETSRHVMERSRWVHVDRPSLDRFVSESHHAGIRLPTWDARFHFNDGDEKTVAYLLVLDTLNFCFWAPPGEEKWHIRHRSRRLDGYYALAAALKEAVEAGVPVLEASFLADMTPERLSGILGGRGRLQLMDRRAQNLNELGRVLMESYGGAAANLVEAAEGSAVALAGLLATELPSFRDVARYGSRDIWFLKRAQLFAADLHGAFQGRNRGSFSDMDRLTAFADYKLPQVLRHLGILVYDRALEDKVERLEPLPPGSPEEVEIRANTVGCVELLRLGLERAGRAARSYEIDWFLWNMGQDPKFRERPYHRTVTVFY